MAKPSRRPEILGFIKARCDEEPSFSSRCTWDSVKDHWWANPWGLRKSQALFLCYPCQSAEYPCDAVREIAAYWSDHEDYDESWTPRN